LRNLFQLVGLRHLKTKAVRTALTTFGISLGIALFVAIKIINHSTLSSFKNSVEALAGKTTLAVTGGESGFPEEKLDVIAAIPGVKHAVPIVQSRAYFPGPDGSSETLMVMGVDLLKEQGVRTYKTSDEQVIDDPLVFLNQPDSLILTHTFARDHGLKMDSVLNLSTVHGTKKFTVRGLLSPSGPAKAFGGGIAIMDIDGARATFGKEGKLDRIDIVTAPGADVEEVSARLRHALGASYTVAAPEGQSRGMQRMVESFQATLSFFSTFALLVGLFLITNSVSMSVAERKKEIGTLRALGATKASILRLILSEAVVMGAVGAFVGTWIGLGLAHYLVSMVSQSLSDQVMTRVEVDRLVFGASDIARAVAMGAVVSLLAAAFPALRAMRIAPLEAMRKHDETPVLSRSRAFRYTAGAALAMLAWYQISSMYLLGAASPVLAALEQLCAVLGPALIGPVLVLWLIRMMKRLSGRAGMTFRLAQDNLLRNSRRTGTNVMSLMVGFILVTLIAVVNLSFTSTLSDWYDKVFTADLLLSSNGNVLSMDVQPLHESLAGEFSKIPGIDTDYHQGIHGVRFIHIGYEGHQIGLKAIDPVDPTKHRVSFDMVDRSADDTAREIFGSPNPVVTVSENFVFHFHKHTGDMIDLPTPSGMQEFRIVGVNRDYASFEGVVYMSRDQYKRYWKDPLVNAFGIYVRPGFDADAVRKKIDQRFGASHNLLVISFAELKAEMVRTVNRGFAYTKAVEIAALLVGLIGLLNTLLMSILERTRELGMLRALGMSRGMLSRMIFQESLIQGGLGAVAAVVLGSWIAHLWVTYSLAHLLGWMVQFNFPWVSVLTTIGLGVAVAVLAGIMPARRASNLEITWALQYE
jgi:putative ABC transport system permease protein